MRPLHRVLLVLGALVAFQGVQACASEDPGLNPQPLPPEQKDDQARSPEEVADPSKATGGGGSTSSSGGSTSGGPNAGVDGDGGDAGGGDSGGDN